MVPNGMHGKPRWCTDRGPNVTTCSARGPVHPTLLFHISTATYSIETCLLLPVIYTNREPASLQLTSFGQSQPHPTPSLQITVSSRRTPVPATNVPLERGTHHYKPTCTIDSQRRRHLQAVFRHDRRMVNSKQQQQQQHQVEESTND